MLGGTGLIGSHVVTSLVKRGCKVRVLSRSPDRSPSLRDVSVELVQGSLEDAESIRSAVSGVDLVFHAAAPYPKRHFGMNGMIDSAVSNMNRLLDICREATDKELLAYSIPRSEKVAIEQAEMVAQVARSQPERRSELHRTVRDPSLLSLAEQGRLDASLHPSLDQCRHLPGLKRLVYTSSVTTIGKPRGTEPGRPLARLAREGDRYDLAPDPSPYFLCKRLLEASVVRAANEGLPAVTVNPTLVVDAGDAHLTTGRLLLSVARKKMPFYLSGQIDAIAGADVGEGHLLAALRGRTGQRYILNHQSMSSKEFLAMVADEAGVSPPRVKIPYAVAESLSLISERIAAIRGSDWAMLPTHGLRMLRFAHPVDGSLATEELGLKRTPVRDAVRRALEWYRREGML